MNWTDREILTGVMEVFRALSARPHGSRNEKEESDWLKGRLEALGARVLQDEAWNLLGKLAPTPGLESRPTLCIQGHIDMVCAGAQGSGYDPMNDPITVVEGEEYITSDGRSSLGADNNMGNAAVLWLLEQNIPHGPLKLLFTTAEEIGLEGAKAVPEDWLEGADLLLNTDGFQADRLIVSSASGVRETLTTELERKPAAMDTGLVITLSGFPGGHSGFDIDKNRPNPIKLMAELLTELGERLEIVSLRGGLTHNAIPADCSAVVLTDQPEQISAIAARWQEEHRFRWPEGGHLALSRQPVSGPVWTAESRERVLNAISGLFNGVYRMDDRFPIPQTSANLGGVEQVGRSLTLKCFIRSSEQSGEEDVIDLHGRTAQAFGFGGEITRYPGWPYQEENPLVELMQRSAKTVLGHELEVTGVHVGLEPGVLLGKNPNMAAVNYGPDIYDAHSVHERVKKATLPGYVRVVAETISNI